MRIKVNCKQCNKEISYPPSTPVKFCSRECLYTWRRENKIYPRSGMKCKPETRAKMSAARLGWIPSESTKAIWREQRKGKGHPSTPETNQKISVALTGREVPLKRRLQISESVKEAYQDPQVRQNHKEGQRRKWKNPAWRMKWSGIKKAFYKTPEGKAVLEVTLQKAREALGRVSRKTSIEVAVESTLKVFGFNFEQAKPINRYIVDFLLPDHSIVIEADGDYWHSLPDAIERDKKRDQVLTSLGYQVVRIREKNIRENVWEAVSSSLPQLFEKGYVYQRAGYIDDQGKVVHQL
jgi:very-short-patch-repair endonuclease